MTIKFDDALKLATKIISNMDEVKCYVSRVEVQRSLWVFYYQSKDYAETGDEKHTLFGNGPIIITKDGCGCGMPTCYSVEEFISMMKDGSLREGWKPRRIRRGIFGLYLEPSLYDKNRGRR